MKFLVLVIAVVMVILLGLQINALKQDSATPNQQGPCQGAIDILKKLAVQWGNDR